MYPLTGITQGGDSVLWQPYPVMWWRYLLEQHAEEPSCRWRAAGRDRAPSAAGSIPHMAKRFLRIIVLDIRLAAALRGLQGWPLLQQTEAAILSSMAMGGGMTWVIAWVSSGCAALCTLLMQW